tara:strand:+ start:44 stop:331 length:288 start_codon:yes stop_codon:yes gene_type:complete
MALFTEAQAQASKLEKTNKIVVNGVFSTWKAQISGSDGQIYSIRIDNLAADANVAAIKNEAIAYLTGSVNYQPSVAGPTVVVSSEFAGSNGDTLA